MQKEKEDFIKEFLKEPKKTGMLAQVVAAEMALISHDTGCCNDGYYLFPKIRKGRAKFNIFAAKGSQGWTLAILQSGKFIDSSVKSGLSCETLLINILEILDGRKNDGR